MYTEDLNYKRYLSILWAAKNEHEAVVGLLLERAADVESKGLVSGWMPLFVGPRGTDSRTQ
jgi:ankyrin repeat protein